MAAAYITVRLLIVVGLNPRRHPDTESYELPVSFVGSQPRPWVIPLIRSAIREEDFVVLLHAAFSGVAFVVLAVSLAALMRDWRARLFVLSVVLLIGLTPRVTMWDPYLLSESIAISLTALLIAGIAHLHWVAIDWRWSTAFAAVFVVWIFTRDGNLAIGVLLVAAVLVVAVRQRRWLLPLLIVPSYAWGWAAAMNDDYIEGYNVVVNIAFHVAPDDDRVEWFAARGMPVVAGFNEPDLAERTTLLRTDPTFRPWANTIGRAEYTRFLATHPVFALEGIPALFDSPSNDEGLLDSPIQRGRHMASTTDLFGWLWPLGSRHYVGLLVAAGATVWIARRTRRIVAPVLLVLSTIPHAVIAYHGSPQEVARHGVVLAFVLTIAGWWCIAVAIDELVQRRRSEVAGLEVVDRDAAGREVVKT